MKVMMTLDAHYLEYEIDFDREGNPVPEYEDGSCVHDTMENTDAVIFFGEVEKDMIEARKLCLAKEYQVEADRINVITAEYFK